MIAFIGGYWLFQAGALTIGTVYVVIFYTYLIFRPLHQITGQLQIFQKAAASIDRVESLINLDSKITERSNRTTLLGGPLAVQFERVNFGYVAEKPVLRDISFALQPGQILGLLGRTGSGKTTLTRLLFRLYDLNSGQIRLGRNGSAFDLREAPLADLRQRVGMVTQNVQLFRATVRDNLTFFDRTIPDEKILTVIDELGLGAWLAALPEGLETELKTGGSNLSVSEAQLLAFTRVFLTDPGLVILDEASSRLDPATEQLIERAIDRLLYRRTGIIVAHRLSTVERADKIMILDQGRIREFGDRHHLATDPGSPHTVPNIA